MKLQHLSRLNIIILRSKKNYEIEDLSDIKERANKTTERAHDIICESLRSINNNKDVSVLMPSVNAIQDSIKSIRNKNIDCIG